jgi:two-component system sensor histidine kinase UhpB
VISRADTTIRAKEVRRRSAGGDWVHRVLRVPLAYKLAGANLGVVLAAWGAYAAYHGPAADWRMLSVMAIALALGLAVNLLLVSIALRPIRDLEETATRVWAGDLETRVPRSAVADAELAHVGGMLNILLTALSEDRARVRTLAQEVVRSGDRERSRVGKELHDSIAQSLAALRYQLIAIEREATDPDLAEKLRAVRHAAGEVLEQVRLLSLAVHPQILDDLGLVAALRQLARTTTDRAVISVTVTPEAESQLRSLPSDVAVAVYRVARESVANALRHGAPATIDIGVGLAGDELVMHVADDGNGFDLASTEKDGRAMGLFQMRERIALLSGKVEIVSTPQQGTDVRVRVPVSLRRPAPTGLEANEMENQHAR